MQGTVAVCQMAVEDLSVEQNLSTIVERVWDLDDAVKLALFPECSLTGFVADERIMAAGLSLDSHAIESLQGLAAERSMALVVGFVEESDGTYYNTTAYLHPTGEMVLYRKRHLWDTERSVLSAGDRVTIVDSSLGRLGLLTCYDLNFVEESAALARPEITGLLVVGAWPATFTANWVLLLRARALDGVRWTIGANRTGHRSVFGGEPTSYAGRSLVVRPDGHIAQALGREEQTIVTSIDAELLKSHRDLVGIFSS